MQFFQEQNPWLNTPMKTGMCWRLKVYRDRRHPAHLVSSIRFTNRGQCCPIRIVYFVLAFVCDWSSTLGELGGQCDPDVGSTLAFYTFPKLPLNYLWTAVWLSWYHQPNVTLRVGYLSNFRRSACQTGYQTSLSNYREGMHVTISSRKRKPASCVNLMYAHLQAHTV